MGYEEWSLLTRSELDALYQRHSGRQIAEMFGITYGAVYHRLRAYGLKANKHRPGVAANFGMDRDELAKLYETMSVNAIAQKFGVSFGAVRHQLRVLGIESGKIRAGGKRAFKPDPEELEQLFQQMSMRDIAKHYGVGETVVYKRIKEYGITGPDRSERLQRYARNRPAEHNRNIVANRVPQTGENNPNWRGGVSGPNRLGRTRRDYREWKAKVLAKADFRCQRCGVEQGHICGCCGGKTLLHAHHVKPYASNTELRYDPDNGVALCGRCHREEHFGKVGELLETP